MSRMAALPSPRAPKKSSDTARTRCGPPRTAARPGASAPHCLSSEGGSQGAVRAVLRHPGDAWCDPGCSGCNTKLGGWGIPCRPGGEWRPEGAALELRLGVGAGWGCCGGWRVGLGADTRPPGGGRDKKASCGSPPVNVAGRTWSLTPQHPEERCQASGDCTPRKRGPRAPEHPGSGSAAVKGSGSRVRGSRGPDSPCKLCPHWQSPGSGGRPRHEPETPNQAS